VGAVLRAVLALRLSPFECREIGEDLVRPLEPLPAVAHEERDFVSTLPIFLPWGDLLRDEIDAELRQPLAHGGRVRTPLSLIERQHEPLFARSVGN